MVNGLFLFVLRFRPCLICIASRRVVPRRTASRRNYNLERDVRLRLHGKHRPHYTTVETRNQL